MPRFFSAAEVARRNARVFAILAALALVMFAAPPSGAPAGGQAAQPQVHGAELSLQPARFRAVSGAASTAGGVLSIDPAGTLSAFESEAVEAPLPFTDLSASWRGDVPTGAGVILELRTGPDGQTWTGWQAAEREDIIDPRDPRGTVFTGLVAVPQDVRTHRFAQARITLSSSSGGPAPSIRDLKLSFVDAGITVGQLPAETADFSLPPAKPPVVSRATWGAPTGRLSPGWPPQYRRAGHIIVHHSDTPNNDVDFAARVRAIWYYHSVTRGWGDIGYNYLIDRRGVVYEGRAGGDDVAGGHAYPFNTGSVGVALVGDFDQDHPPGPMRSGLVRFLTWKVAQRGIDPLGTGSFSGALDCGGSYRLTRPNIAGHRDFRGRACDESFNTSSCPGDRVWSALPAIRAEVAAALPPYRAQFEGHTTPQSMQPGGVYTATVRVRNGGSLVWPRRGPNPVNLAFRWYTLDGTLVQGGYPDFRTGLPRDFSYGDSETLLARVGAPGTPGVYNLRWEMVHEGVAWFGDRGSTPLTIRVSVAPVDSAPPASRVSALNPYQRARSFTVQWGGADETGGSGLASFDVQYRAGPGGSWTDWQRATRATSAVFGAQEGVTYSFRSRATDLAGNVEAYSEAPDAVTTVDTTPPSLTITSPAAGQQVPAGRIQVTGRSDPDALITVNSVPATRAGADFAATLEAKGERVAISVVASDPAGNETSRTITVRAAGRFGDVPPGHPAFDAVEYLAAAGIISGYDDGTFRPDGNATRAQYTKLLASAFKWTLAGAAARRFGDVSPDDWAAPFIESAASQGLISGYADGSFRPADPVTRAQVVKVLVLAAQKVAANEWRLLQGPQSPFVDVPLGHWAYPYVETAYRHGAIEAPHNRRFHPDRPATRAEISMMIYYSLGDLAAAGKAP